jgi:thiamine biosynthesis lipoprotein
MPQRMRPLLGTFCTVSGTVSAGDAQGAIEAAFAALAEVNIAAHPTREGSDLAALASHVGQWRAIRRSTWEVLQLAGRIHRDSDGRFDPCLPDSEGRLADLQLADGECAARLLKPARIDLGGIAKGFAVDQAVDALRRHGCTGGSVNAGGDLRVFGPEPTVIQLRWAGGIASSLPLQDAAVAVSERGSADKPAEFRGYYLRGCGASAAPEVQPAGSAHASGAMRADAAVVAPSAAVADALSTCAMICDDALLTRLLRRWQARLLQPR